MKNFSQEHHCLYIILLVMVGHAYIYYTFMNIPALWVLSSVILIGPIMTHAGLCMFPVVLVLCITSVRPYRTRCWPQTSLLMHYLLSWNSLSCKPALLIIYYTMANNVTLCLYVIKVSYTMVLIFCMCRDSKGADYASKGWPPADGGKLLLHV